MHMDSETRRFIENATLMFIASRNAKGAMDVSPRGGQPCVVRVTDDGMLLLPDYQGNRRLDTIGNLLNDPNIGIVVLNRDSDRYLRMSATADISFQPHEIAAFPADDNPPISVMRITPKTVDFVESEAFGKAGLWMGATLRKPPLDLGAVVGGDKEAQASAGFVPVLKDAQEEARLEEAGVRDIYGRSSEGVQKKVCDVAGPGGLEFMDEANFIVVAHQGQDGSIVMDLTAEAPLAVIPFDNRQAVDLHLPPQVSTRDDGECALLTVSPGRNELLRINGQFEAKTHAMRIVPREIFFHCSAAFTRARIWQDDRRIPWAGRRRFTCVEKRRENPDVTSFVLAPQDDAPVGPVMPGQYVNVSLPGGGPGSLQRCYSVSRRPDGRTLRISVRRTGQGGMSDVLHDEIVPGSELLLGIPAGRFVLSSAPGRPVVLISAGIGITPLLPMLDHLAGEEAARDVWFIHAARDGAHHLFADEVRQIADRSRGGRVNLVSCYSRPGDADVCAISGRMDAEAVARLLPVEQADFYICGPDAFMSSLRDGLIALGASAESFHFEEFSSGAGRSLDLAGKEALADRQITFAKSEKTATWTSSEGSLLDLALRQGIDVSYSCRIGDCQSCVATVLKGMVDYPSGEVPVLAEDQVLLCQAVPRSDLVIKC